MIFMPPKGVPSLPKAVHILAQISYKATQSTMLTSSINMYLTCISLFLTWLIAAIDSVLPLDLFFRMPRIEW